MSSPRHGAVAQTVLARDFEFLMPVYARYPLVVDRGEGVYLIDTDGNRYLDLVAGLGVNALGHAHPRMVAAFAHQATKAVHLSPQYSSRYPSELAEKLCVMSGMKGVFYSTGGSEAVEGALKLARTYARQNFGEGKSGIVSLRKSYHGRTYGSMSVTGQEKYYADFEPGLPGVAFVDRNHIPQLRAAVNDKTCCIILEPVMGEGGVFECSKEYLAEARRLADLHHALLIFDEIQCGLGRTGEWFAFPATGIRPDMLLLGKPLGGGIPLSALLVTSKLFDAFGMAKHGSTLGGSPMACRLGLEFLSVVEDEELLARVKDTGLHLRKGLLDLAETMPVATEARGVGLIQGLELKIPARPIAEAGMERGVLFNVVQGNVVRFLPSFLLERKHVDTGLEVLETLLRNAHDEAGELSVMPVKA